MKYETMTQDDLWQLAQEVEANDSMVGPTERRACLALIAIAERLGKIAELMEARGHGLGELAARGDGSEGGET